MAVAIFVREMDTWLAAVRGAVPSSVPQLVFALIVLGVGIASGRVSRRIAHDPGADRPFSEGAGI